MKTVFRENQIKKVFETFCSDNGVDLRDVVFYHETNGSNEVYGCDMYHDGDLDIEAALKVKPSPASDALAIQIDVLKAKNEMQFAALTNLLSCIDNACASFLPVASFKGQRDQARAALESAKASS